MLNEDMRQCIIYDSGEKDARLIGIEYIIAKHLFDQLPEEEKKYWHSHSYEVTSGQLVAENVPSAIENIEMSKVVGTYGKTWHTWQVDRGDPLPYGPAQLMLSFTADGQIDPEKLAQRDKDMNVSTAEKREARKHLIPKGVPKDDGADIPWKTNKGLQMQLVETDKPFHPADMPGMQGPGDIKGAPQ